MMSSSAIITLRALATRASSQNSPAILRSASVLASSSPTSLSSNAPKHPSPTSAGAPAVAPDGGTITSTSRPLSTAMPRRGFPQYTSFGHETALGVRAGLPQFKRAGSDGVAVARRGKLVLEFTPRNNTGAGFSWSDKTQFSLSVEEVGHLLSRLPGSSVELSHVAHPTGTGSGGFDDGYPDSGSGMTTTAGDVIDKVLTIEPGDEGALTFKVDYMKDGVGGQTPPGIDGSPATPLEVTIQAGDFEVFKSIFQTSIPYLLGWNTTMDIASAAAMTTGLSEGGRNTMY